MAVIHVDVPSLDVSRVLVKVTAIEPGKLYRLEPEGGVMREITVDADGFVTQAGAAVERV